MGSPSGRYLLLPPGISILKTLQGSGRKQVLNALARVFPLVMHLLTSTAAVTADFRFVVYHPVGLRSSTGKCPPSTLVWRIMPPNHLAINSSFASEARQESLTFL